MRSLLLTVAAAGAIFASLAVAEDFSGRLLDSACLDQRTAPAACQATSNTTAFAMELSDTTYRLDNAGNQKAMMAIKNRADRSTDPTEAAAPLNAKISGTRDGNVLKVDTIEVQ